VVVEGPARDVSVEVEGLDPGVRVDRFIEHFFEVGRSTTGGKTYSLGWEAGSGPAPGKFVGWQPDALIPVEQAPPWAPWPMNVAAHQNGVVWIDVTLPARQPPGALHGRVLVRADRAVVATLPLEIDVLPATMPAWPVRTWLFYERGDLRRRIGNVEAAEAQLLKLVHAHRATAFSGIGSVEDVRAQVPAFDGSLYTPAHGYAGPAAGVGDDLVVLGTYGTFGDPGAKTLAHVEAIADELAAHQLFDRADVILYAEDEDCASPRGAGWRAALAGSQNPNARRVRAAWTCSEDPARQPVDVPIVFAGEYDPAQVPAARQAGKEVWIYNGYRPATGALLTDTEATSLRTFGWIAAAADVRRWFIWQISGWYDSNPGGRGRFDPFVSAATGHDDRDGKVLMGDGLMVYPGRQVDAFVEHSLGFDGVVPSIRLKNLRRGIQDAGYYLLARAAAPAEAAAVARELLPRVLAEAPGGSPPAWGEDGRRFFEARRALASLIAPGADPGPTTTMGRGPRPKPPFRFRLRHLAVVVAAACAAAAFVFRRRFRANRRTG
jgi:hypothetical protein